MSDALIKQTRRQQILNPNRFLSPGLGKYEQFDQFFVNM